MNRATFACANLLIWAGLTAAFSACGRDHVYPFEASTGTGGTGGSTGLSSGSTGRSTGSTGRASAGGTGTTGAVAGSTGGAIAGSTGGTTAGSTGGATGGCVPGAPNALAPCQSARDCSCPLVCVPDALGQNLCETLCRISADCPILYTSCQDGTCQPNLCGGLAGEPNGTLDGLCNAVGQNDGSCVPMLFGDGTVGLCYQGGGAIQLCDPSATRANLTVACSPDMVCLPDGAGGQCETLCNPALDPTTCPGAGPCVEPFSSDPDLGICEPAVGGTTSGGSSGGNVGGSTGGSSGGFTGGSTGGNNGGTTGGLNTLEFSPCKTQADCGHPFDCAYDSWAGGLVCEYPCGQTSQCPNLVTVCTSQGVCQINPCGQGTNNGTFDGTCNVLGVNDGTCTPLTTNGTTSIGYCSQGGTSTSDCDPLGNRNDLSRVCPAGQECFGGTGTFGGTCNGICDPNASGNCPAGQFCSFIVNEPDLGICINNSGF